MQSNIAKLLLQPLKPTETLEIFIAPEELVEKSNLGQLFIMMAIKSREKGLKEKVRELIELIRNDYYSSPVRDIESSLESTCQNLNLNLAEIFAKPEIWYQKVNILIGVTKDNVLTFSQVGQFSGYLIRDKKISSILTTNQGELANHTFSQLTTGEVKTDDVVVISSAALFDFFSLEKIREVTLKLKPEQAAEQFKNLMSENIKLPNVLAIIIKYSPIPAEVEERFDQTKKYLQELYGSEESMQQLENLAQRTGRTLTASIWPNLAKFKKAFKLKAKQSKEKKDLKLPRVKKQPRIKKDKILLPWQKIKVLIHPISRLIVRDKKVILRQSKVILGVMIVLVIIFATSLGYLQYHKKIKEKELFNQNILSELEEKKSQAEAVLIYEDTEKANQLLTQALEILNRLPLEEGKWQNEFANRKSEILKLMHKINHIYEVDLEMVVDLSRVSAGEIKQMIKNNNKLYVLMGDNQVYVVLSDKKSLSLFMEKNKVKAISVWDKDNFILLTDENKFYLKSKDKEKELNITLASEKDISALAIYGGRIYFLDKNEPMIYKISKPLISNPPISSWHKDNKELIKEASEMMIDGSIWLVKGNEILKFFQGKQESFELTKLDKNLGSNLEIYTELDWDYIYILDQQNSRLIVANKDGLVKRQFLSDKLNQAQNLIVSDEQNLAWFNVGGEISEVELKEE